MKCINGVLYEHTPEELAAFEELRKEVEAQEQTPEPTTEERLAELEEALDLILRGVTQ